MEKNPPAWLYHITSKELAKKIAREGLIPSGCKDGIGERNVCSVLDNINPIRPVSVYMASKKYHREIICDEDNDNEYFAIKIDTVPCRCKQMNHDLTSSLYLAIDNEEVKIQRRVLDEMGFDNYPWGTDEWTPAHEREFWKREREIKRKFIADILTGEVRPSIRLQHRLWKDTIKDFDGVETKYNEILCPCEIPPESLKMVCENFKGVRKYG
jgi:hypothetical protein